MKIEDYLLKLGLTPNLKGFCYLIEAVKYCKDYFSENHNYPSVCKEVYGAVADIFNTTKSSVERGIRYLLEFLPQSLFKGKKLTNSSVIVYFAYMDNRLK